MSSIAFILGNIVFIVTVITKICIHLCSIVVYRTSNSANGTFFIRCTNFFPLCCLLLCWWSSGCSSWYWWASCIKPFFTFCTESNFFLPRLCSFPFPVKAVAMGGSFLWEATLFCANAIFSRIRLMYLVGVKSLIATTSLLFWHIDLPPLQEGCGSVVSVHQLLLLLCFVKSSILPMSVIDVSADAPGSS